MFRRIIKIVIILAFVAGFGVAWFIYTGNQTPPGETVLSDLANKGKNLVRKWTASARESIEEAAGGNDSTTPTLELVLDEDETGIAPPSLSTEKPDTIEAELLKVVDGDTLTVKVSGEEKRVRLIGVNAEESVHSDETRNNEYGRLASAYLKKYLENTKTIWLEYDQEPQDKYGRELCYVWLTKDTGDIGQMLNAILLKEGYVYTATYKPNIRYAETFKELQETAKRNQTGLWIYPTFETFADQ